MLKFKLHIFPLLEVFFFSMALYCFDINLLVSISFLIIAALFLNFSLHITCHHLVHFKFKFKNKAINTIFEQLYSVLLVLPFNYYRLQHINHHRYNNGTKDITSTFKTQNNQLISKSWFTYCFLWFLAKPSNSFWIEAKAKDLQSNEFTKLKFETFSIGVVYISLFFINPWFVLYYLLLFYLGWTMIAITNYGQHLPIQKNNPHSFSFYNTLYNIIFFNNGLHHEHHTNPTQDYNELQSTKTNRLGLPHFLAGLFNTKHYTK
jgi:fatty acid desaturase